ncbi:MAG: FYDLN acid domain-containing protein [Alphaproteobacteria bacterium]
MGNDNVVQLEWGLKRTCAKCKTHFYDLRKGQISCPNCGEFYNFDAKSRHSTHSKGYGENTSKINTLKKDIVVDEEIQVDDDDSLDADDSVELDDKLQDISDVEDTTED